MTSNYPDRQQLFGLASGLRVKALIFSPLKKKEKKKDKIKKERERKGKKKEVRNTLTSAQPWREKEQSERQL